MRKAYTYICVHARLRVSGIVFVYQSY